MKSNNLIFLENLEWFDETGETLVRRFPEQGSGEIKYGAQLTVRESQAAVFFYKGKAVGAFGPGRHTLKTGNIPILTKIASLPWALSSPLRAEVYFINLKTFTSLKWGTRDPVAFKDSQLGLIRLRAFGVFNLRVIQPVLFINRLVGTQGMFTTEEVSEYLNQVIVSRFNDYMGETIDSIVNLPARYDELSEKLTSRLREDFGRFGLGLAHIYINAITPPPEVQKAIDDRSRMGVFDDMNKLMQMKAAMAMEKAAGADTGAGPGMGTGLGLMLPAMFAGYFSGGKTPAGTTAKTSTTCPGCGRQIDEQAQYCGHCGHHLIVYAKCVQCGQNLAPEARFCSHCGQPTEAKPEPKPCPHCGAQNLTESLFCNQCGEKIST